MSHGVAGLTSGIAVALTWYATTPLPLTADAQAAGGFVVGVFMYTLLAVAAN